MLKNKKIIITRARTQASELARLLEDEGAQVIEFPTIEIQPPSNWKPLDQALQNLGHYSWIIWTSVHGVDFFMNRLGEKGLKLSALSHLKIAAIGEKTFYKIKSYNINPHIVPDVYQAEGLIQSLKGIGLKKENILMPRAKVARDLLPTELKKMDCQVDVVETYCNVQPHYTKEQVKGLWNTPRPDWITFTSASSVKNFFQIVGTTFFKKYLQSIHVACIGPITREEVFKQGFKVHVMPQKATIEEMVRAMANYE